MFIEIESTGYSNIIMDMKKEYKTKKCFDRWQNKKIDTLDYLLLGMNFTYHLVNKYSNRSFNALQSTFGLTHIAQYPIVPWIGK
jgi:hypothetical protein